MPACERRSRRDVQDAAYDPGVANLVAAWERAKAAGDPEAMAAAALALAATPTFGGVPGGVPALLFEARARPMAWPAPGWPRRWPGPGPTAGQPDRAAGFAAEAQADAERRGDPTLLADALDAQLAVHWGPDQLADRLRLTDRLEEAAAHLTDVEARLSAHLWRLSTGAGDPRQRGRPPPAARARPAGDESGSRASRSSPRRAAACTRCSPGTSTPPARRCATRARPGGRLGRPTSRRSSTRCARASRGRRATPRRWPPRPGTAEEFGLAEGIRSITAWGGGPLGGARADPDRARAVLHQLADFAAIPRDVDWLLTVVPAHRRGRGASASARRRRSGSTCSRPTRAAA